MFCSLIKFCKKIEAWYFSTLPQEPMIICRIGFGLILFFAFAWRIDGFNFLFSPDGILGGKFYSTYPNTAPVVSQELLPFFVLREITNYSLILFLYILLLITSLTFAIGFYTRTSGIFLFILHSIFAARMEFSFWGWIYMIRPYILYVIFSKAGNYFSIDSPGHARGPYRYNFIRS